MEEDKGTMTSTDKGEHGQGRGQCGQGQQEGGQVRVLHVAGCTAAGRYTRAAATARSSIGTGTTPAAAYAALLQLLLLLLPSTAAAAAATIG